MLVTKIVVHHSGSDRLKTTKNDIEKWHKKRGFSQIGYHKVIEGSGDLKDGRPESMVGAHAKGANKDALGVCVVGDFEKESPTTAQIDALVELLVAWCVDHKINETAVYGHFEVPGGTTSTKCPGKHMKTNMNSIKDRVKSGLEKKALSTEE